jgi:hypothetical protein
VILDFGQPWFNGSDYGTNIFGSVTFRAISDIESAVQNFLIGYYQCGGSGFIRLAVGTSNYRGWTTYEHGQAWAQMVNRLNDWVDGWSDRIGVRGANDIEMDWNSVANSRAWVDGYADNSVGESYLYNYGDAAGCPPYGRCNNGWSQEDVWYVSWGSPPAYPVPEIYTNGTAQEWYRISLYGYTNHGRAVQILGTLTQWAASGYSSRTYSPAQGWQQLTNLLNADSRTRQNIPYSTDITWSNQPSGAAAEAEVASDIPPARVVDGTFEKDMNEFQIRPPVKNNVSPEKRWKTPTAPSRPEPPWPSGIIESGLAPFPGSAYQFENQWHDVLDGEHVNVYAGAMGDDPLQGVIVVRTTSLDLMSAGPPEIFTTDQRVGTLRIVSAKDAILTLQSSQGRRFSFNVVTRVLSAE